MPVIYRGFPVVAAALTIACGSSQECGPPTGVVAEIIDGDTVVLRTGEKIRYLLADTPEITQGHDDCFGTEARDFNRSLVLGKQVSLRYEPSSCQDRYDRLLAFVEVDGREVNTLLIERGYACVLYIAPAGAARRDEFEALQASAKAQRRGMWGTCPTPCP